MSMVYKTRKNEVIKQAVATTKSMLLLTPSTNAKKDVVMREMTKASMRAMKRGLSDISGINVQSANQCSNFVSNKKIKLTF